MRNESNSMQIWSCDWKNYISLNVDVSQKRYAQNYKTYRKHMNDEQYKNVHEQFWPYNISQNGSNTYIYCSKYSLHKMLNSIFFPLHHSFIKIWWQRHAIIVDYDSPKFHCTITKLMAIHSCIRILQPKLPSHNNQHVKFDKFVPSIAHPSNFWWQGHAL